MARIFREKLSSLSLVQKKIVLPERLKGTVIEKWALYWKNLFIDYRSMVSDLVGDVQEKPIKAMYITGGLFVTWKLAKNNPNLIDYHNDLRRYTNELVLVHEDCQNPTSVQHFKYMEKCFNQGLIRQTNIGIATLLWVDDYDEGCDVYKARCEYVKPGYFSMLSRTVDIGFMGKWWNLYRRYQNFDINEKSLL